MALTASGKISGSVSGGCVEGAVVDVGIEVLRTHQARLLSFGVADETAWEVGLACGGALEIFVQPLNVVLLEAIRAATETPTATLTIVSGPSEYLGRQLLFLEDMKGAGGLGAELDEPAIQAAREALEEGRSCRMELVSPHPLVSVPSGEEVEKRAAVTSPSLEERQVAGIDIFIEVTLPPPTLVIVGGVHMAIALTEIANTLGYCTVVVDPRRAFGSSERFPNADQLLHSWPDKALSQVGISTSTAVAVLTHDPKLDDPALQVALPSAAFYVGALGSRSTNAKRRERLLQSGLLEAHLNRLNAPIGLDLGGNTPEEIALAVMAQVVASRHRFAAAATSQHVTDKVD